MSYVFQNGPLLALPSFDYPEGHVALQAELKVAGELPFIEGLELATTTQERLNIFGRLIETQRRSLEIEPQCPHEEVTRPAALSLR